MEAHQSPLIFSPPTKTPHLRTLSNYSFRRIHTNTTILITHPLRKPKPEKLSPAAATIVLFHRGRIENLLNTFDEAIHKFIDPHLRLSSVDPLHVLSGNFFPVDELPPTDCEVIQGSLPACLEGAYIRNGPNPQFAPRGGHHFLDGDGMLHSIRISSQGRATFCSRYVKTYKYVMERNVGYTLVPNIFSGFNCLAASLARSALFTAHVLAGHYDPNNGMGLANTSLALFGDSLYALCESDLPYSIKVESNGDVTTLERQDFDGKLSTNMTAHPKSDPDTKETFAFHCSAMRPHLTLLRFDANGEKQLDDVPIFSMKHPSLTHDMAITKKFAIFVEIQIEVKPMELIRGRSLVSVDAGRVPRIGIIPRYAKDESEMRWFDVPGFNNLHTVNAWEEDGGNTVVMVAPNLLSVGHFFDRTDLVHGQLEKVRIDLITGTVSRRPLSTRNTEFAVINPAYVSRKSRYVYAGVGDPMPQASKMVKICGIVKVDIQVSEGDQRECIVASRMYGQGCFGGEPFFVAAEPSNPDAEEDRGYLVSFVHNENTGESSFLVMDAQSTNLEIVATVKLPQRVPYGLHGLFVRESDLTKL